MPRVRKPKTEKKPVEIKEENLADVVDLKEKKEEKKTAKKKPKKDKSAEFYAKYSHVVSGSLREVAQGEEIDRGENMSTLVSKGKVCTIQCVDCKTTFEVNVQDAFQSTRCPPCKREANKARRGERRKARSAKKEATG